MECACMVYSVTNHAYLASILLQIKNYIQFITMSHFKPGSTGQSLKELGQE